MTDEQFAALNEVELATLLAEQIEAAVSDGGDAPGMGPTDGGLIAKALRFYAANFAVP